MILASLIPLLLMLLASVEQINTIRKLRVLQEPLAQSTMPKPIFHCGSDESWEECLARLEFLQPHTLCQNSQSWEECQEVLHRFVQTSLHTLPRDNSTLPAALDAQVQHSTWRSSTTTTTTTTASVSDPQKAAVDQSTLEMYANKARERRKKRSRLYPPIGRVVKTYPILDPIRVQPRDEWRESLFPDITVAGMMKSGTSQLYHILSSHNDTEPLSETVEYPLHVPPDQFNISTQTKFQMDLFQFFAKEESRLRSRTKGRVTFTNCLSPQDIILRAQYLRPKKRLRFIVLIRDPADWLWASWNFWIDTAMDEKAPKVNDWADPSLHYRSPELFHEILMAGDRLASWGRLSSFRSWTINLPRILIAAFGRKNVLFARNEDMLPANILRKGGFLDRLSNFTSLDLAGFAEEATNTIHNCNDHKGNGVMCGTTTNSAYAIAGNRAMLPETRKLAYLHFAAECKIWSEEFGIEYPECLNL